MIFLTQALCGILLSYKAYKQSNILITSWQLDIPGPSGMGFWYVCEKYLPLLKIKG